MGLEAQVSEQLSTRLRQKAVICRLISQSQPVDESLYPSHHPNRGQVRHIEFRDWLPPDTKVSPKLASHLKTLAECYDTTATAVDLLRRNLTQGERRLAVELLAEAQSMLQSSLRDTQHTATVKKQGYSDQDQSDAYILAREEARRHRWRFPSLSGGFLNPAQIGEVAKDVRTLTESVGF